MTPTMEHPLALLHGFVSVPAVNLFTELGFTQVWLKGEHLNLAREVERQNLEPDIVLSLARYFVRYDYLAETEPNVFALTARGRVYFGAWGALGRWYSYHPFLSSLPSLARKAGTAGYHQSRQKWLRREGWVGIYDAARLRVIDSFVHRRASNGNGRALDETLVVQAE